MEGEPIAVPDRVRDAHVHRRIQVQQQVDQISVRRVDSRAITLQDPQRVRHPLESLPLGPVERHSKRERRAQRRDEDVRIRKARVDAAEEVEREPIARGDGVLFILTQRSREHLERVGSGASQAER